MSLIIKDGAGVNKTLKTGTDGSDLVPYHAISGTVATTISGTPTVALASNAVTASITGTPTVTLASNAVTASISGTPTFNISSTENKITASILSSEASPIYVTGNLATLTIGQLSASLTASSNVTMSALGSNISTTLGNGKEALLVHISGSPDSQSWIFTSTPSPQVSSRQKFKFYNGIDYSVNSGTFEISNYSMARKSLTVYNPGPNDLYISIGGPTQDDPESGSYVNGFLIEQLNVTPASYNFVIYASGTYTADEFTSPFQHGGFFISQSDGTNQHNVALVTRISYY